MSKIITIRNTVVTFLKENVQTADVTVIRVEKLGDTWKTVSEVYEDDSFLKSMNLPLKKIRLFYAVTVDSDLEVISFSRLSTYDDSESENN